MVTQPRKQATWTGHQTKRDLVLQVALFQGFTTAQSIIHKCQGSKNQHLAYKDINERGATDWLR